MPTESRILGFNKTELFEALRDYCSQTGRLLPDDVNGVVLTQNSEVSIALNSPGDESSINFTENEIGAALVMFCIKKGIPIARRAIKSLEVVHETLSLRLRMGP